jgi:hypothetical protein
MKYLFFALFLLLTRFSILAEPIAYTMRLETNTLSFKAGYGDKVTLSVGMLFYKDQDGDTGPTADSYIVELVNNYPQIIDSFYYGHHISFQLIDLGKDNTNNLAIFYHSGAHQYGVRIYKIVGIDITPLKTQPDTSNMGSVKIKGGDIIIGNQEIESDGTINQSIGFYRVVGDNCELVNEKHIYSRYAHP